MKHQLHLTHQQSLCIAIVLLDPSLSLPGALKGSDAVLESDAPNARLGREPTPEFIDSIGRDSHVAAFFTWGVLGQLCQ